MRKNAIIFSTISTALLSMCIIPATLSADDFEQRTGELTVLWGDPAPFSDAAPAVRYWLADDAGVTIELEISEALSEAHGGFVAWNGSRVEAFLRPREDTPTGARSVAALRLLSQRGAAAGGVSGTQPWVSILCKFSDQAGEPENLGFFSGMYANSVGGLDHYWREVSYDTINVAGSTAIDWVNLPQAQTFYVPTPGSNFNANLSALFNDCTAAADPFVDFGNGGSPFVGINMMFNALLDCCAWGGSRFATLDGVNQSWRVTWEPPWGYANVGVIAHEMGHGFGLPHATNWDNDDFPYDSPWDVMSDATGYGVGDATYGQRGKHVNAYHKDTLGWIPSAQRFEVPGPGTYTVTLDGMAIAATGNHRMVVIPLPDSRFYTIEARVRSGAYEASLPGDAVLIHEIAPGRDEPSWAYDAQEPPADYGDNPGTMWTVGETFEDTANQIFVTVTMATASGFEVEIVSGPPTVIFTDGFETGDDSAWSATVP
jgi:hypothetical protein